MKPYDLNRIPSRGPHFARNKYDISSVGTDHEKGQGLAWLAAMPWSKVGPPSCPTLGPTLLSRKFNTVQ